MIERLRAVISEAESLTEQEQEQLALAWEQALEELEEREWEGLLARPGSKRFLKELVEEARREHAAGETEEITGCGFGLAPTLITTK